MTTTSKGHLDKGFTLIELLVVIAIIGILSSVVLASLNTARAKGKDAKVKAELAAFNTNAELFYDSNAQSYGTASASCTAAANTVFGTTSQQQILKDLTNVASGALVCNNSTTAYAIQAGLNDVSNGAYFCVDSTGKRATTSIALASNTACQ